LRTRSRLALAGAALLVGGAGYLFLVEPEYSGSIRAGAGARPLVFGHRGFGNYAPDNSLVAARMAIAAGLDGVDMDGQRSRDGELVIFHDLSVDRLTSGTGRVASHSLAELRALDLGPKYGPGFKGAFVATFEDVLAATHGKGILMVELKVPGLARTGIEERAVELVKRHDAFAQVYFSSFNPVVLWRLKHLDSRIHTVFILMDTNWNPELRKEIKKGDEVSLPWVVRQEWIRRAIRKIVKPDLLSVNIEVAPGVAERLISKGWPIFLWVPETEPAIRAALAKKPYGVISDEPQLVKTIRDGRAR
jgi:glycerophosphoryl diester phosphodiesterase